MNRIKTLLIVSLVIALSFSMIGCSLLPSGSSADVETGNLEAVPQWLTLAHRAEAAEQPEIEEEEADEEEAAEVPVATQPATTQPATEQPASTAPAQTSGTPKWQQPGTMEYLAKLELDRLVNEYIGLKNVATKDQDQKDRYAKLKVQIPKLAAGLAIHADTFKQLYGITAPYTATGESAASDFQHSFDNFESPSGWGSD